MRSLRFVFIAAIALMVTAAYGDIKDESYIYKGAPLSSEGITVGSWGSGKAVESTRRVLTGSNSIEITSDSYYAGGKINFTKPVTLFSGTPKSDKYIVFTFYFEEVKTVDPAAGTGYSFDVESYIVPKISTLRFVFTSEDETAVSVEEQTGVVDSDDNWVRVAVPLTKLKLPEGEKDFRLETLVICSDVPGMFYLGEIKLATDDTPIKVDSIGSQTVAIWDQVFVVAQAEGGVSTLKYSWDFDDKNGIQEEQTGKAARYVFTRGGDYTVTLTVSDADGIKSPVKTSSVISVID
jgi:hypothetical protein